jgi:hypothetical protein
MESQYYEESRHPAETGESDKCENEKKWEKPLDCPPEK